MRSRFVGFILAALAVAAPSSVRARSADVDRSLESGFRNPPQASRPQTWFHWMNGNIDERGITTDLEAIKSIGLGGVQLFNVNCQMPEGDVAFLSPKWRQAFRHTLRECDRLGLEFSFHITDGWSETGGPWVTPEHAMQRLVSADLVVAGSGAEQVIRLPTPPSTLDFYRDVAVLAFPAPTGDEQVIDKANIVVSGADVLPTTRPSSLPDDWYRLRAPTAGSPSTLDFDLQRTVAVRAVTLSLRWSDGPRAADLQVSDDGKSFRTVGRLPRHDEGYSGVHSTTWALPEPALGQFFRVVVADGGRDGGVTFGLTFIGGARIDRWETKAGDIVRPSTSEVPTAIVDGDVAVDPQRIVDLTDRLAADGSLRWQVPPGNWTVLRLGRTLTGRKNQQATPAGLGLECDKMNPVAVREHFDAFAAKMLDDNRDLVGRSLTTLHLDSWEALCQNWTPSFREDFTRLRGYDPLPYLPAMTGRIVRDSAVTHRFLWDVRRTIADLVADHHYGLLRDLANQRGVIFASEAIGPNPATVADALQCKSRVDMPVAEFWVGRELRLDVKEAAASAHVLGKTIVAAEAFTAVKGDWTDDPASLKPLGDAALAAGINRFIFHRYTHQPWPDRVPGMTMGQYGINFERTNTWWTQSAGWIEYLARCQHMLLQGKSVADVLYFYGEGAPNLLPARADLRPVLPLGWDYDACSAEDLVQRASVRDGKVVFPSGASYSVLVLPDVTTMTPHVLDAVSKLVEAGAVVVGPKPVASPSLSGYPACDEEIRAAASRIWGDCDGTTITAHPFGKGTIHWGRPLNEVLAKVGTNEDVRVTDGEPTDIRWIHRRTDDADVYFVVSTLPAATTRTLNFRADGKPQRWDPRTGSIQDIAVAAVQDGRTTMPLQLEPFESTFVVFRRGQPAAPVVAVESTRDARPAELHVGQDGLVSVRRWDESPITLKLLSGQSVQLPGEKLPTPLNVEGTWTLSFPPGRGAPAEVKLDRLGSWTDHTDEGVKHFSGTASYTIDIDVPSQIDGASLRTELDLGEVKNIAELRVNDGPTQLLWTKPFRVDVTDQLRVGRNRIEVRVTNLWPNRLIGDLSLPEDRRTTWATYSHFKPDSPLLPSGLLGPVQLVPSSVVHVSLPARP
jgi:hypothetical protein